MIAGIVLGCYAVTWLLTARILFARWRGADVGRRDCHRHGSEHHRFKSDKCCYDSTSAADGEAAFYAITAAVAWPLVLLVAAVRFRPPPTAAERAEAEKKLKARIAELEREAGLTQGSAQ